MIIALYWYSFHLTLDKDSHSKLYIHYYHIHMYVYIILYIYIYIRTTTTQCKLPKCKCVFLRQRLDEKAPPAQVSEGDTTTCASGLSVLLTEKNHHHCKMQLVTTTTCASGMFAPVERRETPQAQVAKVRASISAS